MRPFALGGTAFLITLNALYLWTRGAFYSPDSWSDIYMVFLVAYAGAPEIKRWMKDTEPEDAGGWPEKIRKGGPIITVWVLLLLAAGVWRIADPTRPMPPELKETTIKVISVFFGAYALRQFRRTPRARQAVTGGSPSAAGLPPSDASEEEQIVSYVRANGPQTPKALSEALAIPRRSMARLLTQLQTQGRLKRDGGPFDPSATYHISNLK